ncbi:MAG TPA: LCP family protein [Candidatus Hydrogenedentes bacterium]|nr:LCP family protein [Candidatus Hydrogenedentota bacterium]
MKSVSIRNLRARLVRAILYLCFALCLSTGAFFFMRYVTACWQLTSLPGVPPAYCHSGAEKSFEPSALNVAGTPATPASSEIPAPEIDLPQWDGGSRINIAFFGLRGGDIRDEGCPACTDTIILLTIDPLSKTAGMLSIPRDLWVAIPGFGHSRINTAWTLGEAAKLPGGGPGLAMETVSQLIGVPVHYYVQVDFGTFISFINLIGGIDVYVEQRMVLDPTGSGQDHFVLKPGDFRHLTGKRALAYARCRDESQGCSDGDVGRAKRQQQVILAIRDKVFDPAEFPKLLAQAPALFTEFSSGVHTNLSLEDAIKLAVLARDIPLKNIKQGVIDNNMAVFANTTLDGVPASVLRPVPDLIRVLRDEIFTVDGPASPLAQGDLISLMQSEAARVRVTNNTYTAELARRTATFLQAQGVHVTEIGVPTGDATQTMLIMYSPRLYTLKFLTELFNLTSYQIVMKPDSTSSVDIEIRLGEDWVGKLPEGY